MSTTLLPPFELTVRYTAKPPLREGLKLTSTVTEVPAGIVDGNPVKVNGPTWGALAVPLGVTVGPPSEVWEKS